MKILVMGAGAVGGYFGARLREAGEEVVFCARGDNLRALRARGLKVKSFRGDIRLKSVEATDNPREFAPYDLILFCVKAYDTEEAARQIDGCLAPGGAILTLQNGVENEARLCELFGTEHVMGGNARVGVELSDPGVIAHHTTGVIQFGELDGSRSARADSIAEVFDRAGILGELSPDIRTLRWYKLLWNGAFNVATTLTRLRVGELLDDPEGLKLVRTLMEETLAVARADGAVLSEKHIDELLEHSHRNLRALKTSTLQDFERGRRLEYEALSGAVLRAARRYGIKAPATETVYALLRLLDRGRRKSERERE
ncbi:MAG: 2-dehydropantoate 2-reductase [Candidatus Binataceae bacterium]